MDRSVRPQDDFFRYVNGAWVDKTAIPADQSSYGSFAMLRDESQIVVKEIIEQAATDKIAARGSVTQKVGDLYRSFMDTARIEELGLKPLEAELSAIAKLKSTGGLAAAFAHASRIGIRTLPVSVTVGQDAKDSRSYAVYVSQGTLGMPDRDYYLRPDEKFVLVRKAYTDYIAQLFKLGGRSDPQGAAKRIL